MQKGDWSLDLAHRVIFTYSIAHLTHTDKVRFYYALKGRNGTVGIVKKLNIVPLGRTVLLAKGSDAAEVRAFLDTWDCSYKEQEVWMRG